MGTIRFETKKEKIDKEGKTSIRVKYQVQGERSFYPTGQKLYPHNWDQERQQAIYVSQKKLKEMRIDRDPILLSIDIEKINNKLSELTLKIKKIEDRFALDGIAYTAGMVVGMLKETSMPIMKKDKSSKEVYAYIDKYISEHDSARKKGSLSVYKALKKHLQGYEKEKNVKVAFDKIDPSFFRTFRDYLYRLHKKDRNGNNVKDKDGRLVKALNNITVNKQLSTLKTFLNYAKEEPGIELSDKYNGFKISRDKKQLEVIALNQSEFDTLWNLDLSERPAWDQVRDVFCFSCVTGLRYSDLANLKWNDIKGDEIEVTMIKTDDPITIPLNPFSKAILQKYQNNPTPLPIISNQKSNEHLGKICKFACIDTPVKIVRQYGNQRVDTVYKKYELVRLHAGRKTFASLSVGKCKYKTKSNIV
jgi:integrase